MKKGFIKIGKAFALLFVSAFIAGITSCDYMGDSSFEDSLSASPASSSGSASGGSSSSSSSSGSLTDGALTTSRKSVTAPSSAGTITLYINDSQSSTYSELAAAFEAIPASGSDTYKITLTSGTYNVTGLTYKGSNTVKVVGLGSADYGLDVVIYGQGSDMSAESTRSTLSFQGSCNVVLQNLTVKNSYGTTSGTAQAEALGVGPTAFSGMLAAYNCSFLSGQDTICTYSKAWFYKCYVEGDVDFLWMETATGKVALYENCVLRAIGSRTTKAYFTAPRLAVSSKVWKGLVIFNSTLEAEDGLSDVYLGRNPWDADTNYYSNYYENVAVVGSKYYGNALNSAIWSGKGAHGTTNQQYVGFKTDSHFPASTASNNSAVLTTAQVEAEYAGRNNILNRYYDIDSSKFKKDSDSLWDITGLESEWGITADTSKSLLDGETEVTSATFNVTTLGTAASGGSQPAKGSTYTDGSSTSNGYTLTWSSLYSNGNTWSYMSSSSSLTLTVSGASVVTVKTYDGIKGLTVSDGTNNVLSAVTTSTAGENAFLYTSTSAATLTFTVTGTTYIDTINVVTLTDEVNGVKSVSVAGDTAVATDDSITLTANVTKKYLNDLSYTLSWSSSNESLATVTDSGVVTGHGIGSVVITASAGGVSGEYTVATGVIETVTWAFTNSSLFSGGDATLITNSFTQHESKYAYCASGTLTFWVVANCTITINSNYSGIGTLTSSSGTLSKASFGQSGNNFGDVSDEITLTGVTSATKITLTATDKTYLSSIVVAYGSDVASSLTTLKSQLSANSVYNFKTITKSDGTPYAAQSDYPTSVTATSGTNSDLTLDKFKWHGASYGLCMGGSPATISIPVTGACKIYLTVSYVGSDSGGFTITDGTTPISYTTNVNNNRNADCWTVTSAGTVTLTASYTTSNTYCISSLSVIYVE